MNKLSPISRRAFFQSIATTSLSALPVVAALGVIGPGIVGVGGQSGRFDE